MAVCKSLVGYYISMGVIVALMFDKRLGTARFQNVKHKASSNAFYIYVFHRNVNKPNAFLQTEEQLQRYSFFLKMKHCSSLFFKLFSFFNFAPIIIHKKSLKSKKS